MIYDCFLFFDELDVLQLRLEELNSVVDRFVLVEGTRTFSGNPKPLHFENNKGLFQKYLSKIRHIVVDDAPRNFQSAWDLETHQRNAMLQGLTDAAPDDTVVISDVDEIPRATVVAAFNGTLSALELDHFYYRLNCRNLAKKWVASLLIRREHLTTPQEARMLAGRFWKTGTPVLRNAGWHFSCTQDAAGLKLKLQSFSHQEYNTPKLTDINSIQDKIKYGLDLVDRRDQCWCCVPLDDTFPAYLVEHRHEFVNLLFDFVEFHQDRQALIYSLREQLQKTTQTIAELRTQVLQTTQQLQQIQSSKSWRFSAPFRTAARLARRLSRDTGQGR